ncbi:MAG: hypothetical protein N2170_08415 [Bacteroidia bacterium]|nr:hypothetical protein [Bacteroidia bacterium]
MSSVRYLFLLGITPFALGRAQELRAFFYEGVDLRPWIATLPGRPNASPLLRYIAYRGRPLQLRFIEFEKEKAAQALPSGLYLLRQYDEKDQLQEETLCTESDCDEILRKLAATAARDSIRLKVDIVLPMSPPSPSTGALLPYMDSLLAHLERVPWGPADELFCLWKDVPGVGMQLERISFLNSRLVPSREFASLPLPEPYFWGLLNQASTCPTTDKKRAYLSHQSVREWQKATHGKIDPTYLSEPGRWHSLNYFPKGYNPPPLDSATYQRYVAHRQKAYEHRSQPSSLRITPNPARDLIELFVRGEGAYTAYLVDVSGRKIILGTGQAGEVSRFPLHVSPGRYYVEVQQGQAPPHTAAVQVVGSE